MWVYESDDKGNIFKMTCSQCGYHRFFTTGWKKREAIKNPPGLCPKCQIPNELPEGVSWTMKNK